MAKRKTDASAEIKPIHSAKGLPKAQPAAKKADAPVPMIGNPITAPEKKETVQVQAPQMTAEETERRKKLAALDEAMMKVNMYPVATSEETKNAALASLKKAYAEGDDKTKQVILYMIHETVLQFSEYRAPKNFEYFRKKFPQADPAQLRMNVYKSMFNYSNSLEGLMEMISLLGELGDNDSAKVLTTQFSFLCAFDGSEGSRMLRNAVVDALGESKSVYALNALLTYVKNTENESLGSRVIGAIVEWKEKVSGLKIEQKRKDEIMKKINDVVLLEKDDGHYR